MATEAIGFVSQQRNGVWGPVFATEELAKRWAAERRAELDPTRTVLPVTVNVPDAPPRPSVLLSSGERVRWNIPRNEYTLGAGVENRVPTLVDLVRRTGMTDADIAAVQALPAETVAWAATGGRD